MNVEALRAYDELFKSPGWKNLLEEAGDELRAIKEELVHHAPSFDVICNLRGQAFQLDRLINLEESLIAMVQAEQANNEEDELYADL